MAPLSVIVTCKGRLEHLRRTLPALVRNLAGAQIILVDYDCPQHAGDWAAVNAPDVEVVRVTDRPIFNLAKARNLGAARATAPWLLFTDADVEVTAPLLPLLQAAMAEDRVLLPDPRPPILFGTVAVARADFERVGGYDEIFEGWGSEDEDFLQRLADIDVSRATFDGRVIVCIEHRGALRTQFHEVRSQDLNWTLNGVYLNAKRDLNRLGVAVSAQERQTIYSALRDRMAGAAFDGRTLAHQVTFRRQTLGVLDVVTSLRYDINLRAPVEDGKA